VLLTEQSTIVLDRRRRPPTPPGQYSPGILKIEKLAEQLVGDHDKMYLDFDDNQYQTKYSLLMHQAAVARVMEQVGRARQRNDALIQLGRVAALLHDMGKLHVDCQNYRTKRRLSDEEREHLTELHSTYSLEFAEQMMPLIRAEDRVFLSQTFPLIRHHHKPWRIRNVLLREIGYDLMVSDAFRAIQESRENEARAESQALEIIELWDPCERYPEHEPYKDLIGESKRAILWLFSLNENMLYPNPFAKPDA
jgi:CRISPR/Cas system-associated endonuclease Cas3-HD